MPRVLRRILYGAAAFGAAFVVLWLLDRELFQQRGGTPPAPDTISLEQRPRVDLGLTPISTALNNEMALVIEKVMPGVVSIQVRRAVKVMEKVPKGGQFVEEEREIFESGSGSGTIIGKDGHILTNWHVVEGGENAISITLSGGEASRSAKLIDKDDQRDLALLKIDARPGEQFSALRLGDSSRLRVGHTVLAAGSPFGLRETVTRGIISNCARRVSDTYTSYLQTDCVINPGNSGGPLVNLQGDVVGIVTRKLLGPEDQASSEGYGLAIPSNDLALALDTLMNKGRPLPYAGVMVENWPERYWQNQKEPEAAIVKGVTRDSPAEKAGLKFGDIIESLESERITSIDDFWRRVRLRKPGDTITMTLRRGKGAVQARMTLSGLPKSSMEPSLVRGITIRQLRPYERGLLHIEDAMGLHVEEVASDSPLAAVIFKGMNILHLATPGRIATAVVTPEEFRKGLDDLAATGGFIITGSPGEPDNWVKLPPFR